MFNFPRYEEDTFDPTFLITSKRQEDSEDYSALSGKGNVKETTVAFSYFACQTPDGYKMDESKSSTSSHESLHTKLNLLPPKALESSSSPEHIFVQNIVSENKTL